MTVLPRHDGALSHSGEELQRAHSVPTADAVAFSVVIPAFNEVERLPIYLTTVLEYLECLYGRSFEVLVVDDGSHDGTAEMLKEVQCDWPRLRVLRHAMNRGKGAAVRTGMLAAAGDLVLFADADGATPISEERQLRDAIAKGADIAIGSRLIAAPGAERNRHGLRFLASYAFAKLVGCAIRLPVGDTQCGFKMFRRPAAQQIFRMCDESGYLFDVQVLLLGLGLGYKLTEIGISWRDIPGSKVHLLRDSWKMATGLWNARRRVAHLITAVSCTIEIGK